MKTLLAIAILLTNLISPTEFVDTSSYPKYDEVWNCGQEYLGIKHNDEIFYLNQQLEVCFSEDEYDYTVNNFPHDFTTKKNDDTIKVSDNTTKDF